MSRAALVLLMAALGHALPAQNTALILSDSLLSIGDSAGALVALESAVRREPENAAAWHRRGMLAWAMARSIPRRGILMTASEIRLRDIADTSLRIARHRDPDNARYSLDLGRHFLWEELPTLRIQAPGQIADALRDARRQGDTLLLSEAEDEMGMVEWRRYEAVAGRRGIRSITWVRAEQFLSEERALDRFLEDHTVPVYPPPDEAPHTRAAEHFMDAVRMNASNARAWKHIYMLFAEGSRWDDLLRTASERISASPWDPVAWLAKGLASHRVGDHVATGVAFDSALALLPPSERARYADVSRILRPADSASYTGLAVSARQSLERLYWALADPLMLTRYNEFRNEFLARMVYAELRWTSEDLGLRGADTDRGQTWIRYGPPEVVASFGPGDSDDLPGFGLLLWYYPRQNLHFVFKSPPTWGTASMSMAYMDYTERARRITPVTFRNLRLGKLDSLSFQATRFRAAADSSDIVVFAEIPLDRLVRDVDLTSVPVDVGFIAFDEEARILVRDSSRQMVAGDWATDNRVHQRAWRHRFAPGFVGLRVEALQPDAERGARAADTIRISSDRGFGMSDLLLGERVTARGGGASRWSDMVITPAVGRVRRGNSFALLWETYALEATEGASSYRVQVTLSRSDRSKLANAVARMLGGTGGAALGRSNGKQEIALSFNRQVPAREVSLDYVTLDVSSVPAGRYRLVVEITDLVSGRSTSQSRTITIL